MTIAATIADLRRTIAAGSTDSDCNYQVRVEGTTTTRSLYSWATLNSGDAVFCSA